MEKEKIPKKLKKKKIRRCQGAHKKIRKLKIREKKF